MTPSASQVPRASDPRDASSGYASESSEPAPEEPPSFDEVYEQNFAFVWRNVRSLGAQPGSIEDVVQDVFLIVHRKMSDYDAERASMKTWLFGILRRVVRDHRRTVRRKPAQFGTREGDAEMETISEEAHKGPHETAARAEAVRLLESLLASLDEEKREVFVLAEIEQMTVPEIAQAIDINVNTAYARLRAARQEFEQALARRRAGNDFTTRARLAERGPNRKESDQ